MWRSLFIALLCIFMPTIYSQVITTAKPRIGVLEPPECGYSNATFRRIVGGQQAELGAWPWATALGYVSALNPGRPHWGCAGSLISAYHVLTAAHCIYSHLYVVRIGDLDLDNDNDGAVPFEDNIKQTEVHPNFDSKTLVNDVAILRIFRRVPFTSVLHPVCLPYDPKNRYRDINNLSGVVIGWGRTSYGGISSRKLLQAQVPLISVVECKRSYPVREVDQRTVCAGGAGSACHGDSGSGLMIPSIDNPSVYYIYGIVSIVNRCNDATIFTSVTGFVNYIILNSLY